MVKQPDKTISEIFAPTLQGFKKKYDLGLSYTQRMSDYGIEVIFLSERFDAGVVKSYGFHEVDVFLGLGNYAINQLLDARDAIEALRPRDPTGPSYGYGNGEYRHTVLRKAVGVWPFDPVRDQTYMIRFDHLETDTHAMHERFRSMMMEHGFPWFERYADPVNISRDINDPIGAAMGDRTGHTLCSQHDMRAEIGIAAACVAESDRVPELYERWLEWRRRDDEFAIPRGRPRPFEPDMQRRFDIIIDEARARGYAV